ncbi:MULTISPECIES: GNAT family N-acetyltransferase [Altibacter]|uniref:GNAT family N-acetyltransferase n=1 Tax=Altibacter TaxID=1535231 RepID=UPI000554F260|nr:MULTISPECIES: GNAT family N-acetyltransferase [Altibacter]MCW8980393.1 GNAT family N-acetyltransferase [Altibacter sp.]MCW9038577.1 GNAT family N-acetyltransferase [Altibacter sp.]
MEITVKTFEELTVPELYDLLQLRSEVFVVEQDCVYQDIDGKDQKALHIIGRHDNKLVAYTRCFPQGVYFKEAAIGRVVVAQSYRKYGYGHEIMQASIAAIKNRFETESIKLSAQTYLIKFYESHGFTTTGEGYLEDGIPHIAMVTT